MPFGAEVDHAVAGLKENLRLGSSYPLIGDQIAYRAAAVGRGIVVMRLVADDLDNLPFSSGLSRAARSVILQNVVVSLGLAALLVHRRLSLGSASARRFVFNRLSSLWNG